MKLTSLVGEFNGLRFLLTALAAAGAPRLCQVTHEHLGAVLAACDNSPAWATSVVRLTKHLAAHGPFLTVDRLTVRPWPDRAVSAVIRVARPQENSTARIPETIAAPLIKAAVFYVQTASGDILAARQDIAALQAVRARRARTHGRTDRAIEAFIAQRRHAGRAIPALPFTVRHKCPAATVSDGIVQAPGLQMITLLAGTGDADHCFELLSKAGDDLGYEEGGLDTVISPWPDSGTPWRARLGMSELRAEMSYLRTACWITIAYLSGMRDGEVRELGRGCAFSEPGDDGRTRYKLRGRVYKDRELSGEQAEWVVLEIVHRAVAVLQQINDDPTHLFGFTWGAKHRLMTDVPKKLDRFRDHCNQLFSQPDAAFIPADARPSTINDGTPTNADGEGLTATDATTAVGGQAWAFNTRQFRRTLAWHIAHQPFGVVAGAKQYKHAAIAMFEGYAGTSPSGFAAEVASEQATALLDYAEDLYRDWNGGGPSSGGATRGINAEFDRVRRELHDPPGTIASPARLRAMLEHLTKTLHPGVLNDCFYHHETAVCAKRAATQRRPLPLLNMCTTCPNARRSTVHLPRLTLARDQALQALQQADTRPMPPLQRAALTGHAEQLDQLITQITDDGEPKPA